MTLAETRRSWHGAAELLLAGPQHALSGTIRLRPTPGGFGTVTLPDLRVEGATLVHPHGRAELDGRTPIDVAEELGLATTTLDDVYSDGSGVLVTDVLRIDVADAVVLATALEVGDAALRRLASEVHLEEEPVLWPEHLDVALVHDEVNYGVSLGDASSSAPYAYVGPWAPRRGDFWTAPFGAARRIDELGGVDEVAAFFAEGRERAAADPRA
jgi:hypothetical protein